LLKDRRSGRVVRYSLPTPVTIPSGMTLIEWVLEVGISQSESARAEGTCEMSETGRRYEAEEVA
jgi:hypothetical protein